MSSTVGSTADHSNRGSKDYCCRQWGRRGDWSLFNIAAMVIGFALFWPIGLLILYWILKGRSVKELPQMIRENGLPCLAKNIALAVSQRRLKTSGSMSFSRHSMTVFGK